MQNEHDEHEEIVAVLLVLRDHPMTSAELFRALPKVLRDRWSEHYLRTVILQDMEQNGLVTLSREGFSLHYRVARPGKRLIAA